MSRAASGLDRPRSTLIDLESYRYRQLGDTAELPAVTAEAPAPVPPSRPQPGGRGWASVGWFVAIALLAVGLVVAFIMFGSSDAGDSVATDDENALVEGSSDDESGGGPGDIDEIPTVDGEVAIDAEPVGFWRVVGVNGGLNVRAEPGVNGERLGALEPDEVVEGTGRSADLGGSVWREVVFDGKPGWVAAGFLAAASSSDEAGSDDAANDGSGETVPVADATCFEGTAVNASVVVVATGSGDAVRGVLRSNSPDTGVAVSTFRGDRIQPGVYDVTRSSPRLGTWSEQWTISDGGLESSNGWSISAQRCSNVGSELGDLLAAIPQT